MHNWFTNARSKIHGPKTIQKPATDQTPDAGANDDAGDSVGRSVWGKTWNYRTVAGHIHKADVQKEVDQLVKDGGYTPMAAYQPALTAVYNQLSAEEKEICVQQAKTWNSGSWPRELQISYVSSSCFLNIFS